MMESAMMFMWMLILLVAVHQSGSDADGFRVTPVNAYETVAYETVCNVENYKLPYMYHVALKSGYENTALTQCPSAMFGRFKYNTCTDPASNTSMDVCSSSNRDQLIHNYTLCSDTQMFSLDGTLDCVYFASNETTTYLTVYNRDNTAPNDVSTFRFSCMALTKSDNAVTMTVYPERCLDNQNSTTIASPGYHVIYTAYDSCLDPSSTTQSTDPSSTTQSTDPSSTTQSTDPSSTTQSTDPSSTKQSTHTQMMYYQCTFPETLAGTWTTSGQGTWIVNSTHIRDFKTTSDSGKRLDASIDKATFECHENREDTKYVLKSSEPIEYFVGVFVPFYFCMDFEKISATKYIFYKVTAMDVNGDQFTVSSSYETVCNRDNYKLPYSYRVAVKSGFENAALIQCPSSLFGRFTYDTCTDQASSTIMDVCSSSNRDQLIHNYTLCSDMQMFSLDGTLDCVYFVTSGSTTYLTVYNRDNTASNDVSTFRFSCVALTKSGNAVTMTVYPERCLDNQNSTTIASPGYHVIYTAYDSCLDPSSTTQSPHTQIIAVYVAVPATVFLIAVVVIVIFCNRKKWHTKESIDPQDNVKGVSHTEIGHVIYRPHHL